MAGESTCRDLHHDLCTNRAEDIDRMLTLLERWRPEFSESEIARLLETALTHAVQNGHDVCVNFLYSQGATGNIRQLLITASQFSHLAVFEILLKKGCTQEDVNASFKYVRTMLRIGSTFEIDIVKLLLEHNFTFNAWILPSMRPYWNEIDSFMLKFALMNGTAVVEQVEDRSGMSLIQDFMKRIRYFRSDCKRFKRSTAFEFLNILHQCGANFAEIDPKGKSALDRVNDAIIESQNSPQELKFFVDVHRQIQNYLNEPLSLQSLTRVSLIRHFKCHYMRFVDSLSEEICPREVIRFLKGDDMKVSEKYSESEKEHSKIKIKVSKYGLYIFIHFNQNSELLTHEMRREFFPDFLHPRKDIDSLKARLKTLEAMLPIILKRIYNIQ